MDAPSLSFLGGLYMARLTKEEIFQIVEEEGIEFIRLQFTDIFGVLKNLAVTTSQLEKALNNRVLFDGSAIEGFVGVEESDMYLHPDLETFAIIPWRPQQGKVARLLCDIYYPDGRPFEGDPRLVLKREIEKARREGYRFRIGPECEFFLYHLDDNNMPTTITHEKAGYFDVAPADLGENARRDIILTMEQMGYDVESSYHEFAPAQHEIDLHYSGALRAADTIETFRLAARTVAKRHGLYATFMPKPKSGVNGSGMHINVSLVQDGVNAFEDENDPNGLSKEAYYFIGGIMKHVKEITAFTNPLVNSYKRLVSGYDAPKYIAWSQKNRSILIRIPATRGFNTRIELRGPDSAANPYLTLALIIAAGMDGIRNQIMPSESVDENMATMTYEERKERGIDSLPMSLGEALQEMKNSQFVKDVLGDHIVQKFCKEKEKEWQEYQIQVSEWELERYLGKF